MMAGLSRLANADLKEAGVWIRKNNPTAALKFRKAAAEALRLIGSNPEIGVQKLEMLPGKYRVFVLNRFPYVMIYNHQRRPPVVARILHGARDLPTLLQDL